MKRKPTSIKPKKITDFKSVIYTQHQWHLLDNLRIITVGLMEKFYRHEIKPIVYGSIARGDVSESSDIDLFIPYQISSFNVETILQQEGLRIYAKKIVQATPKHVIKAHIYLDEQICITFPLTSLRDREFDFIHFGGSLSLEKLKDGIRVPGVNKMLILIEPTVDGHNESPVIGFESIVANKVGVSVELVKERVRVLTTRDRIGRTGVYLQKELAIEESFEEIFKELIDKDPIVRRRAKM